MGKPKLEKFAEVNSFPNVFQNIDHNDPELVNNKKEKIRLCSLWNELVFQNNNPIVLELACGKGDYTLQLARKFADKNFIGIDIKGSRIWTGAKFAMENDLKNVVFLRSRIEYLEEFFAPSEVDEIWITFPDPYPRTSDRKHRLSHKRFLDIYRNICKKGSTIHFKTDNETLVEYSLKSVKDEGYVISNIVNDIYSKRETDDLLKIQTYYEKMHLAEGRKIYYFSFKI